MDKYLSPNQRWTAYEPLAKLIEQVMTYAERLGVKVVRKATLEQFGALCGSYPVVSLVAHWRSARFRESDLVDRTLLERMARQGDSELGELLRRLTGGFEVAEDLLTILNKALAHGVERGRDSSVAGSLSAMQIAWHRRRGMIEGKASGLFRSGASVEFGEGLQSVEAVLGGLPPQTLPLLDLTICNSVLLAQAIGESRPGTHALCNEKRADLAVRIAFYRQVIGILNRKDTTFQDACFDVRRYFKR
jgi:hypothetical protein